IGPSALYRHFSSKQELLVSVIEASVAEAHAALADARDDATAESLSDWNDAFVAMALDIRLAGVLWQREARQLPEQDQERLAAE
ncbi:TetR family transcriptional regulator, partial [Vibrio vulnificus]